MNNSVSADRAIRLINAVTARVHP